MRITISDIQSRLETIDFDISRDFETEKRTEEKANLVDILNWMIQHDMLDMVFNKASTVEGVHNCLFNNSALVRDRQLIVMQGVPGAGKSEVAKILALGIGAKIVSNNDYMVDNDGRYRFDPKRLEEVANKCYAEAKKNIEEGWSVIVDNTNVDYREAGSFIELGLENGYRIQIVRCDRSAAECVEENIHGVPSDTIFRRHGMMKCLVN